MFNYKSDNEATLRCQWGRKSQRLLKIPKTQTDKLTRLVGVMEKDFVSTAECF